jgi:hypothetical protein
MDRPALKDGDHTMTPAHLALILSLAILTSCRASTASLSHHTSHHASPPSEVCDEDLLPDLPPRDTPYIGLGFFFFDNTVKPRLGPWAREMSQSLGHPVVDYHAFSRADVRYNGWADKGRLAEVEFALITAIQRSQGHSRVVLFNLDGFDTKRFFAGQWPPLYDDAYTAREAQLILCTPCYAARTRWYRDNRELSAEALRREFGPYLTNICQ